MATRFDSLLPEGDLTVLCARHLEEKSSDMVEIHRKAWDGDCFACGDVRTVRMRLFLRRYYSDVTLGTVRSRVPMMGEYSDNVILEAIAELPKRPEK